MDPVTVISVISIFMIVAIVWRTTHPRRSGHKRDE